MVSPVSLPGPPLFSKAFVFFWRTRRQTRQPLNWPTSLIAAGWRCAYWVPLDSGWFLLARSPMAAIRNRHRCGATVLVLENPARYCGSYGTRAGGNADMIDLSSQRPVGDGATSAEGRAGLVRGPDDVPAMTRSGAGDGIDSRIGCRAMPPISGPGDWPTSGQLVGSAREQWIFPRPARAGIGCPTRLSTSEYADQPIRRSNSSWAAERGLRSRSTT